MDPPVQPEPSVAGLVVGRVGVEGGQPGGDVGPVGDRGSVDLAGEAVRSDPERGHRDPYPHPHAVIRHARVTPTGLGCLPPCRALTGRTGNVGARAARTGEAGRHTAPVVVTGSLEERLARVTEESPAGWAWPSATTEAGPGRATLTGCRVRRARSRCPSCSPSCGWSRTVACTSPTRSIADPADRVGGCGPLSLLPSVTSLRCSRALRLMIALSDNDATNAVLDRADLLATGDVDRLLADVPTRNTRLRRRMMDPAAVVAGRENQTCPADLVALMVTLREEDCWGPTSPGWPSRSSGSSSSGRGCRPTGRPASPRRPRPATCRGCGPTWLSWNVASGGS